jgi:hypothetical protein
MSIHEDARPSRYLTSPRRLRPSLRRRLPLFALSVLLLAMSTVALFYSPLVGVAGVLLFGFGAFIAALRLFHARAYATELDAEGFSTFDSFGRRVHRVAWADVEHLTVVHGNGIGGPGTVLFLAWRCHPRQPGHGKLPWLRARRNFAGEEIDGALPDPYLGIEPTLELFKQRADAAKRAQVQTDIESVSR